MHVRTLLVHVRVQIRLRTYIFAYMYAHARAFANQDICARARIRAHVDALLFWSAVDQL